MLAWALREAFTRPGVRYARLHVSGSNLGAKRLYERMGFRTLEVQGSSFMTWLFDEREWNYMIHEGLSYLRGRNVEKNVKKKWGMMFLIILLLGGTGTIILWQNSFDMVQRTVQIDTPKGKLTGVLTLPVKYSGNVG